MSNLKESIKKMYRDCGLTVPIIMASSPVHGAFLSPILAHAHHINDRTISDAKEDAKEIAFAHKPLKSLLHFHETHITKQPMPPKKVQPGGKSRVLQHAWRVLQMGHLNNDTAQNRVIRMAAEAVVRSRVKALFNSGVKYHDRIEVIEHIMCWPNKRFVVLSEKPTRIILNNNRQLHSTEKLAVKFPDGWGVAAINGNAIPPIYLHERHRLTLQVINNTLNVETKRALIELFGFERFLKESHARLIHSDLDNARRPRRLWALIDMADRSVWGNGRVNVNLLEVVNSTPEPDGTYKQYFLQVPGDITSIDRALMWMLDDNLRYAANPSIET